MNKIIILAYYYPPCNMPGANRPYGWAKFLSENGYYPIIITRSWENEIKTPRDILLKSGKEVRHEVFSTHEVFYVPYKQNIRDRIYTTYGENRFVALRRVLTFFELLFSNFFTSISSFKTIYTFSKRYINNNSDIKFLIATGAPYLLFRFSYLLHKKFKVHWIADYRDDWGTTEIDVKHGFTNWLLRRIELGKEKKWVGTAITHTAVSPYSVYKNTKLLNKKGFTIHNGYMPEDYDDGRDNIMFEKFTITFVGTLYPTQKIEIFLEAFKKFIDQNKNNNDIHLLFPGLAFDHSQNERVVNIMKGYEDHYSVSERIPKKEIIDFEKKSHVFLYTAHHMRGIIGSKIYEYVYLRKPVIFCPSDGETIEQIFRDTGIGYICKTSDEALDSLNRLYSDFRLKKYGLSFNETQNNYIEFYSRRYQTKLLAEILDEINTKINTGYSINSIGKEENEVRTYKQCVRCVMDTSDPNIVFDENGYCNHCNDYYKKISKLIYQGKETDAKLAELIARVKKSGKNKVYDCIVGVSGGVDSIYTAYLAKKLGLRPLAVHMDNGWNSELAVSNIEKILDKLDIELYTYVLDWEEFRDLQLAFLMASVIEAETPTDIAIPATLHKVAVKYGIKYIFSGGNYATEGILPKYWHYNAKDLKYLYAINNLFGTSKLKHFPTFGYQREIYYKFIKGIRMIYLLNYVPYKKEEAIKILKEELEWRDYGGKHHESIYTKFIQSYLLLKKFGIDYRRATLSTQICSGQINREQALSELNICSYNAQSIIEEKRYISKKLLIKVEDLDEIINLPAKSYKNYPNDEKLLELIYKVYRKIN